MGQLVPAINLSDRGVEEKICHTWSLMGIVRVSLNCK